MKKLRILIIFMLFLTMISTQVFAQQKEFIKVQINGKNVDVRKVEVLLDGQALKFQVPSFIYIDRTLVPVRFVAENYGATVEWEQKTKTATIFHEDNEIKLTIDNPIATVNGQAKELDKNSIPKLVSFTKEDARTMVPLAFISEILGYEVGYDEERGIPYINSKNNHEEDEEEIPKEPEIGSENIISQIYFDKGSTNNQKLVIKGKDKIQYTTEVRDNNKLIMYIENAKLDLPQTGDKTMTIPVSDNNIKEIEYSQHSNNPYITRVMVTMNGNLDYDITPSNDDRVVSVSIVNKIGDINLENINGREVISISGAANAQYKIIKLSNPGRIVVDLLDSSLKEGTHFNHNYNLGFINGVRGSQFQGDQNYKSVDRIVRVVLDIKEGLEVSDIKIDKDGDKLIIYPEKSIWEQISYNVDGKNRTLNIKNMEETSYSIKDYPESKMLEIKIPANMTKLESGTGKIEDGLIGEINVIRSRNEVVVQVKYQKSILYEILSKDIDNIIKLSIKRNQDIKPQERLIVIDPGHGGSDPGAVSPWGTREKDINTRISLKTRDALEDLGYNVLMTRDNDKTLQLSDRTNLANKSYADLFISFHANSYSDSSVKGIQVLYCPAQKAKVDKDSDQYPLAKSIMDELLKGTGAVDKGIIQRSDLYVLNRTTMPAVLIEVGFLTNPEEEKLIQTEEYQNKIVKSVIKGIENYFEIY